MCTNEGCTQKFKSAGELSNHVESSHIPLSSGPKILSNSNYGLRRARQPGTRESNVVKLTPAEQQEVLKKSKTSKQPHFLCLLSLSAAPQPRKNITLN